MTALKKTNQVVIEQEKIAQNTVRHHSYPLAIILLTIQLIIYAGTAFRSTAKVLVVLEKSFPEYFSTFRSTPHSTTIESWLLRVGLHKLTRPKEKANDWIIAYDFIVQAGSHKCLLVIGTRRKYLLDHIKKYENTNLTHTDFEVLAIVPMEKSSGEKVHKVLEEVTETTGPAAQLLCDGGSDVAKGSRLYKERHPETICSYDSSHKFAVFLKHELKNDITWTKISKLITRTKQRTKQSRSACFSPPKQREKSRLMNSDVIVDWLVQIHELLEYAERVDENWEESELANFEKEELQSKLSWVTEYSKEIKEYDDLLQVVRVARHQVRQNGLHKQTPTIIAAQLQRLKVGSRARAFSKKIIIFLEDECCLIKDGQILLGSSEIIESIIGRYKIFVERTTVTQSITGQILMLGCIVGENTAENVKQALETVSENKLDDWLKKNIGTSDIKKRRRLLGTRKVISTSNNGIDDSKSLRIFEHFTRRNSG